ncbi:tyrosine-type recombinase/integrase [Cytobacillus oceanisediminis]|uniref:tyrosine-type recombinase/integrase n=1 Tax=Cytobacillus oceanisediminis TaxID=665099 RepID=UPI00207AFFBD|nr:tyrosine-type recombinase/integrase [Cytobacillus oceanisediminis]USK46310.1 site-specific integrase [Cytobacillus oceanisediminis]
MATYRKRGDRWEYRISYKDPFTQKNKLKSKSGFKTKKEAQAAAATEEIKLKNGLEFDNNILLEQFLSDWLHEYKSGTIRKNTFELHERNIQKHIIPYFKKISLTEIKPIMYQKFLNHLSNQGYSKRTIEIIHSTLNNAMEKAVILGKIEKNPCKGVTIKGKKKDAELKFLDSSDIAKFLREAYKYDYIYWLFFKVLIDTGMRKGEAAALQWSDIDLKEKTITINKTLDFSAKKDEELFGDTKTYNSKRIITISQVLANDLHFHKKYQNQNKIALNDIYHHNLNLVLCRNDGNFMPKSSLFNAFSRILKKADLPSLPIHSLRHTHAVVQLEAGADMKYVQERLGHGSIQVTSDVYAHISKKIEKDTMDKYESYMKNILE